MISLSRPKKHEHDFWLHTDGSGHTDGLGGAAAILIQRKPEVGIHYRWTAQLGTSVNRMELSAMLLGMESLFDLRPELNKRTAPKMEDRPTVWWETDRENVALAVWRHPSGQIPEEPFYSRGTDADLWHRYAYYERRVNLTPIWVPRNESALHCEVDELAGYGRECAKDAKQLILKLLNGEVISRKRPKSIDK